MKYLISFFAASLFSFSLLADCTSNGMQAFPRTENIKQYSWIVLQGYAGSQTTIKSLGNNGKVYLQAEGHLVKLKVKEIHEGMFFLTQAILVPEEKLIAGKTYHLKLEHHLENNTLWEIKWDEQKSTRVSASWTVEEGVDITPPALLAKPTYKNTQVEQYGCGPAVYANFKIPTDQTGGLLVLTELVEIETGESHSYYLSLQEDRTLSVGHGMCSGAFNFKNKGQYKVRFKLFDYSGNTTLHWTDWSNFKSPFEGA